MKRLSLIALLPVAALAQVPVEYRVSFDNAVHHEARITVTWRNVGDGPLAMRMSRSSPGRYALHEFGKNIYSVIAVDGAGRPLDVTRPDPYQWDVAGHDGTVTVQYTLYADRAGGTYSGIDLTHAHLNMPATFAWARGFEERPINVTFVPAADRWRVATQLVPTEDPYVFTAPNLQYFFDSPTELSEQTVRSWEVSTGGRTQTIRLAVHHAGTEEDVDRYVRRARNVVDAQIAIFGELPPFDFGTYTFIADYLPYVVDDGMEHRNSTILTSPQSLMQAESELLGGLAHEFFHAWNVERIRPAGLEPFDFERANMTDSLWFAEGFTSYYGELAIRRGGESSIDAFAEFMSQWVNAVTNSPGRGYASPRGMSRQAPFLDAARAVDPSNFANTVISYYTYGAAIALALDLTIRAEFDDSSLDSLMRHMWQNYGKPERPYMNDDLRAALAAVTGSQEFAEQFFARYIDASQLPDYAALLANAGMNVRRVDTGKTWAGPVALEFDDREAIVGRNTVIGTPLYDAGLDRGDRVVSIGRRRIASQRDWDNAIDGYEPGDVATITFVQRGIDRTAEVTFEEDPSVEVVRYEDEGRDPTAAQLTFRRAWLGEGE